MIGLPPGALYLLYLIPQLALPPHSTLVGRFTYSPSNSLLLYPSTLRYSPLRSPGP